MSPFKRLHACLLAFSAGFIFLGCGGGKDKSAKVEDEKKDDTTLVLPKEEKSKDAQQTVQFLGGQGRGRRFCIIADCSKSLSPDSFEVIKKEVAKTLESLDETSEFHLMFFADKPYSMPGSTWMKGKSDLKPILSWIDGLSRVGGTIAVPPFKKALGFKPRPDVIFFMTDGRLPPTDPERIASLNEEKPQVMINTILFTRTSTVVPADDQSRFHLERIAGENGGEFKQFIDPNLPKKKGKKKL